MLTESEILKIAEKYVSESEKISKLKWFYWKTI